MSKYYTYNRFLSLKNDFQFIFGDKTIKLYICSQYEDDKTKT